MELTGLNKIHIKRTNINQNNLEVVGQVSGRALQDVKGRSGRVVMSHDVS